MSGDAHVIGPTTIDADNFALAGPGNVTWTLDRPLAIDARGLSRDFPVNELPQTDADFVINADTFAGGKLTITGVKGGRWLSTGDITINGPKGNATSTSLAGDLVTLGGVTTIDGNTIVDARFWLSSIGQGNEGVINLPDADDTLRINGGDAAAANNSLFGATIIGNGTLRASPGKALRGTGLIATGIDFDADAELSPANGLLQLGGPIVDVGLLRALGGLSTLDVLNPWNTSAADHVLVVGGLLTGATAINDGANGISGFGNVTAPVINNSVIEADAQTLTVADFFTDWDGTSKVGRLLARTGNLTLIGEGEADGFGGTAEVAEGFELHVVGFDLAFAPGSTLVMDGGRLRSDAVTTFGGDALVQTNAADLETNARLLSRSITTLDSRLNLRLDSIIEPGAAVVGSADLANHQALEMREGASIDVSLAVLGTLLTHADGVGLARVTGDVNLAGTWLLELAGNTPDAHDRLIVSDTFTARGDVVVELLGYDPVAGDAFDVLDFATFVDLGDTLDLPGLSAGLSWDASDFESIGLLRVVAEPATSLLALVAAGGLLRRGGRCRRRRG